MQVIETLAKLPLRLDRLLKDTMDGDALRKLFQAALSQLGNVACQNSMPGKISFCTQGASSVADFFLRPCVISTFSMMHMLPSMYLRPH